jgi:hypothetical protein
VLAALRKLVLNFFSEKHARKLLGGTHAFSEVSQHLLDMHEPKSAAVKAVDS